MCGGGFVKEWVTFSTRIKSGKESSRGHTGGQLGGHAGGHP